MMWALGSAERELKERVASLETQNAELRAQLERRSEVTAEEAPASIVAVAGKRLASLVFFLCCLSLTTVILESWEETLARHVELTFFVPLMIGHGGNTGGSTVGATVAKLARGPVSYPRTLARELGAAGLVAASLAGIAALVLPVVGVHPTTAAVVTCAIASITLLATVVGASLPFLFRLLRLDAAVLGPPAVTTLVDSLGLCTYLLIAQRIIAHPPS